MSRPKDATEGEESPQQRAIGSGLLRQRRRRPQVYAALGLVVVLSSLLVALSLFQLTAPGPAHRALRRAVASLTEIDSLLAVRGPALREHAEASPNGAVSLPDYPLDVSLSPEEARRSTEQVRDLLLDRSAEQAYLEGSAAFRAEGESGGSSGLSLKGFVRLSLGLLTASRHDALRVATVVLAILCGVLSCALVLLTPGYRRLTALGSTVAASSLFFLLLTVAVRLALALAGAASDDYIAGQLLDLAKDAAWLPLRNGLAFGGLGVALVILGVVGSGLSTDAKRVNG
jgi:hypothetical protein